jgi:hypothetical protein
VFEKFWTPEMQDLMQRVKLFGKSIGPKNKVENMPPIVIGKFVSYKQEKLAVFSLVSYPMSTDYRAPS